MGWEGETLKETSNLLTLKPKKITEKNFAFNKQ